MAKQIEVKILGRDFSIACPENEEDSLMKSINYLNHKIDEVQASGSVIGVDKTIIMAALNITHEYLNKNNNADADVHNLSYKNKLTDFNKLLDSILD
ncbi:cell division protein ZapA [Methylophilaceae bacterium]|jgi:cell division protein ZapA|nr:cell division protein ZapA [Betaproteobacteria bacterium]MDA7751228.1 cell division protein ZapA [Methylophilaceae bacterium]MCH9842341.1 cell division protein ZapA [Betaproteobacteria bacterium]MDA9085723.1 cell division protein ZapA [Methylophilaceae bacterium]MDC0553133.1 cell division protein ZapA [Methylophilaceae bacterium]